MATLEHPFEATSFPSLAFKILNEDPTLVALARRAARGTPELDPEFQPLVDAMLVKDAAHRAQLHTLLAAPLVQRRMVAFVREAGEPTPHGSEAYEREAEAPPPPPPPPRAAVPAADASLTSPDPSPRRAAHKRGSRRLRAAGRRDSEGADRTRSAEPASPGRQQGATERLAQLTARAQLPSSTQRSSTGPFVADVLPPRSTARSASPGPAAAPPPTPTAPPSAPLALPPPAAVEECTAEPPSAEDDRPDEDYYSEDWESYSE